MTDLFIDGNAADCVPASDRGFLYGHGLFETMRLWHGDLPLLDLHLDRLERGARALLIDYDQPALKGQLADILPQLPADGLLKLVLTAGDGKRGYHYCADDGNVGSRLGGTPGSNNGGGTLKPRCVVQYFALGEVPQQIALQVCEYRLPHNPVLAGIKHLNRLDQVLAAASLSLDTDGLLLDQAGYVIEALSSNLFIFLEGTWITPSLDKAGVAGVMRRLLMDRVMPTMGFTPQCRDIDLSLLRAADEVFICNGVRGISAVTRIRGVGQGLGGQGLAAQDLFLASATSAVIPTTSGAIPAQTALIKAQLRQQYPCFD